VQAYIKNLTNETVITDHYQTDDTSGLFTNIFLTDPRTYGVAVTKSF
jgi:outer membrane receptor protein involved in Fe transport